MKLAQRKLNFLERIYLAEIWRGLTVTIGHFFKKPVTIQYPEKRRQISPVFRGRHVLKRDEQGRERCVACGLCALVCPSEAITIEAAEATAEEMQIKYAEEKYAKYYKIDMIRCIFCGFCEEACPKGAIFLTQKFELASYDRAFQDYTKDRLLENKPSKLFFRD